MLYDDALKQVGEFGRYQILRFLLCCAYCWGTTLCMLSYVFIAATPDHWCRVPHLEDLNITQSQLKQLAIPMNDGKYSQCEVYDLPYKNVTQDNLELLLRENTTSEVTSCKHGWTYDQSLYQSTISMEWNLVCDQRALKTTSQSIYMCGLVLGAVLSGWLSDRFGRRTLLFATVLPNLAAFFAASFSVNYVMYVILRFVIAFTGSATYTTAFVLALELVGPSWRAFVGISICYPWAVAFLFMSLMSYLIPMWRTLNIVLALACLVYIPALIFIPESPRWLLAKGRYAKAVKLLHAIAKTNRKSFDENDVVELETEPTQVYLWHVLMFPRLRRNAVIVFIMWFSSSLVYFGLTFNNASLGGNDHVTFSVSGLVEIAAYAMCNIGLKFIGRRPFTASMFIVGGAALLATLAVPEGQRYEAVVICLVMVGKFGLAAVCATIFVYTAELFPTTVRQAVLGTASAFSRIASILAPQIGLVLEGNKWIPLVVLGFLAFLSGMLCLLLPETSHVTLPETLEEAENMGRKGEISTGMEEKQKMFSLENDMISEKL